MSAQIDTSNLTKIGNMTSGGGLAAIMDGSTSTVGYAQSTTGYAGVTLASPARIDRVILTSADNGFDASGLTTGITLYLYGKVGAAPSHAHDGQLLGQMSFTDQNITRTITIESANKVTQFDHVWAALSTGVWCILSEFSLFAADEPVYPDPLSAGRHVFVRSCNDAVSLMHYGAEISQYRTMFRLNEPRVVLIDHHADVVHVGTGSDAGVAVGYSFGICRRYGETFEDMMTASFSGIPNAVGGGNVINRTHHYGRKSITTAIELPAGYHEISVIGSGHTDGSSTQGLLRMLVEGGKGLNALRVIVEPSETIFH